MVSMRGGEKGEWPEKSTESNASEVWVDYKERDCTSRWPMLRLCEGRAVIAPMTARLSKRSERGKAYSRAGQAPPTGQENAMNADGAGRVGSEHYPVTKDANLLWLAE